MMRSQWSIQVKALASRVRRWYVSSWSYRWRRASRPVGHHADDADPAVARAADPHHRPNAARRPGAAFRLPHPLIRLVGPRRYCVTAAIAISSWLQGCLRYRSQSACLDDQTVPSSTATYRQALVISVVIVASTVSYRSFLAS